MARPFASDFHIARSSMLSNALFIWGKKIFSSLYIAGEITNKETKTLLVQEYFPDIVMEWKLPGSIKNRAPPILYVRADNSNTKRKIFLVLSAVPLLYEPTSKNMRYFPTLTRYYKLKKEEIILYIFSKERYEIASREKNFLITGLNIFSHINLHFANVCN